MFKVRITNHEGETTERIGGRLWDTVSRAVMNSWTFTMKAFIIGIVADAISEEVFTENDAKLLKAFLREVYVPKVCSDSVEMALDDIKGPRGGI